MKNKFINLLSQEPNFSLKIGFVILLIILAFFSYKDIDLKVKKITKLRQDKVRAQELEKQIPALEETLKVKTLELKEKATMPLKPNLALVLKGIITKDGESAVLINDEIYQKNDLVSGLMIIEITSNTVTLQDPITAEQSKIQLPE